MADDKIGKETYIGKNDRPWPNSRLKRAAIIGHTDHTSTRLWFRTADKGEFSALIYERPKGDDITFRSFNNVPFRFDLMPGAVRTFTFSIADWNTDTTHVIEVDNLNPCTEYAYALYAKNEEEIILGRDRPHFFRTMPEDNTVFSFALFSCNMPYKTSFFGTTGLKNEEMWGFFLDALKRHYQRDFRFVICGGDQVYADGVKTLSIWKYLNKKLLKDQNTGRLRPVKEDMLSWYRDIYRGYWGFNALRNVFSNFPTYMMWDDHELCDGWGSYYRNSKKDLYDILPNLENDEFTLEDGKEILNRMERAGKQVYWEYQHSHNPKTNYVDGVWDYGFYHGDCAFYFLDGRGHRDINRSSYRILGEEQFERFKKWVESGETRNKQFLFVLSAVPVFHLRTSVANKDKAVFARISTIGDDLRDSWEHDLHIDERKKLCSLLFAASARGQKVSILSGDVHMAAAYKIKDSSGSIIYQLTSSAITYHTTLLAGWILGTTALPEEGTLEGGLSFERLGIWTQSNFSILRVWPDEGKVEFRLYTAQSMKPMEGSSDDEAPMTHSLPKIVLDFT